MLIKLLFAVTTALPFSKAFFYDFVWFSIPPINSTTILIESSSSISSTFVVNLMLTSFVLFKLETTPMVGTISTPARAEIIFLLSNKIFATLVPTVPTPIIPTFLT